MVKCGVKGLTMVEPAKKFLGIKDAPPSQISAFGSLLVFQSTISTLGFSATHHPPIGELGIASVDKGGVRACCLYEWNVWSEGMIHCRRGTGKMFREDAQ
ncbi:hypothetical protein Tco_1364814 [Tanacetum coccineum]